MPGKGPFFVPETQYLPVGFELKELKAVEGGWQFSGHAAVFGNVDAQGDVILRTAFDKTLTTDRHRPLLWQHDMREPIGVEQSLAVDEKGLFGTWKLIDTARGTDAYKLLKAGAVKSMSIGYIPVEAEYDDQGFRILKEIDLFENSVVSMPANSLATVTSVKAKAADVADEDGPADEEAKATWDSSYVSNLPDSAFAVVVSGGVKDSSGKTVPRDLRKLPHHDTSGKVDLPHLRNALAREPQTQMSAADHATAHAHLQRHADAAGIGSGGKAADDLPSLSDLPLSEHAEVIEAEFATFVARAQEALSGLSDKGRDLSRAKRLAFEELLERCSGLETVRSDLANALAAAGPPKDRAISLNPVKRRLESTRRRLLAEGILPPADDAAA